MLNQCWPNSYHEVLENLSPKRAKLLQLYFEDLYPPELSGYVKVSHLKAHHKSCFYSAGSMSSPAFLSDKVFRTKTLSSSNLFISMNGFKTTRIASQNNLLYINAFAIDVDFA